MKYTVLDVDNKFKSVGDNIRKEIKLIGETKEKFNNEQQKDLEEILNRLNTTLSKLSGLEKMWRSMKFLISMQYSLVNGKGNKVLSAKADLVAEKNIKMNMDSLEEIDAESRDQIKLLEAIFDCLELKDEIINNNSSKNIGTSKLKNNESKKDSYLGFKPGFLK